MPDIIETPATDSTRADGDETLRKRLDWLFNQLYIHSWLLLGLAAVGIAAYAFTVEFGEGARAIIFFTVPSLWGAFTLMTFDAKGSRMLNIPEGLAYALAGVAGLVLASVLFLDWPVSIANLALGVMEAFFLLMRLSDQQTEYRRWFPPEAEMPLRALLIMVTVTCIVIAVVL